MQNLLRLSWRTSTCSVTEIPWLWLYLAITVETSSYPGWIKSPHVVTCHTYFPIGKICHNFIFFWGGGGICSRKITKCQDLPKFQFPGGGGVICNWKITKCQGLAKFQFSGGGGGGVICNWKITKCQDLAKFQFSGGGGVICNWKITKCQDLAKFQFSGGGGNLQLKNHKVPRSG